jgi:hypothetical protein
MACEKCRTINTPDCDTDLCDIVLPADCVSVKKLDCLDNADGSTLQSVLEGLDEAICAIEGGCETLEWTRLIKSEQLTDAYYATTCQDKVELKGSFQLDDTYSGILLPWTLPLPSIMRILTVNVMEAERDYFRVLECNLVINTNGTLALYFNPAETVNNPPTLTVYLDGNSYFLN